MLQKITYFILRAAVSAALCLAAYLVCRSCLQDNGGGADAVRGQLNTARNAQQSITDNLDEAAKRTDGVADSLRESDDRIASVKSGLAELEGNLSEAGKLIADCQRILDAVRQRGEADAAAP